MLYVGDEVPLEPAKEALRVVARDGRAPAALFPAPERGVRRPGARTCEVVEVRRAGDEGVRGQREQEESRRRARPHKLSDLIVQLAAQNFGLNLLVKSLWNEL